MTRKMLMLLAVGCCGALTSRAEVEMVIFKFSNPGYTVPNNKVLYIHRADYRPQGSRDVDTSPRLNIRLGEDIARYIGTWTSYKENDLTTFYYSAFSDIWIGGGWRIETANDQHACSVIGKLMDPEDVFASIPNEFETFSMTAQAVTGRVRLQSPRPSVLRFEESRDHGPWRATDNASVDAMADKRLREVAIPMSEADATFYRIDAKRRD